MTSVVEAGTGRVVAWKDSIPLSYEYTAGTAGEVFLRAMKEGRIVASKCSTCGEVRLPPRTYCLECGGRTRIDVEVLHPGRIASFSTVHLDRNGTPAKVRTTFALVTFEGVRGGLIHRILHGGRRDPQAGGLVRPRFLPPERRKGSILDLDGFVTAARRLPRND